MKQCTAILRLFIVVGLLSWASAKKTLKSSQFEYDQLACNLAGPCERCNNSETELAYCQTGYKQRIECPPEQAEGITGENEISASQKVNYKSCIQDLQLKDNTFYLFQATVLGLLLLGCYVVVQRKRRLEKEHREKIARQVGRASSDPINSHSMNSLVNA